MAYKRYKPKNNSEVASNGQDWSHVSQSNITVFTEKSHFKNVFSTQILEAQIQGSNPTVWNKQVILQSKKSHLFSLWARLIVNILYEKCHFPTKIPTFMLFGWYFLKKIFFYFWSSDHIFYENKEIIFFSGSRFLFSK